MYVHCHCVVVPWWHGVMLAFAAPSRTVRMRVPDEADGLINGGARFFMQRDYAWQVRLRQPCAWGLCSALTSAAQPCPCGSRLLRAQLHSFENVFDHPTWPTEWRIMTVFMAWHLYQQTGDASLADVYFDVLLDNSMVPHPPCSPTRHAQSLLRGM